MTEPAWCAHAEGSFCTWAVHFAALATAYENRLTRSFDLRSCHSSGADWVDLRCEMAYPVPSAPAA